MWSTAKLRLFFPRTKSSATLSLASGDRSSCENIADELALSEDELLDTIRHPIEIAYQLAKLIAPMFHLRRCSTAQIPRRKLLRCFPETQDGSSDVRVSR
jgi:hypothetical protein